MVSYRLERIHLEVTNVCNFKCDFCPDAIMERKRGHMDLQLLEQTLDEIAEHHLAKIVAFHLMGEPLIYPHIFQAIDMALTRGLNLHLTTNGSTFHIKPEHRQKLIHTGIPKVTISLQTPDPETFIIRGAPPQLKPEQYFDGIIQYVKANLADPTSPTRVHLKFLDTTPHPFLVPHKPMHVVEGKAQMQQELTAWADRLLDGCDERPKDEDLRQRIARHKPGRWQVIELTPKLALETFPLDSWGNVESTEVIPATFGYCNGTSDQAGILYDGTVVPCCKDYDGQIPLGNVKTHSLRHILDGQQPACGLRQGFNQFKVTHPICQRCMGADTPQKALLRQVGSVAYFKVYHPIMKRLQPGWGEV
ncbi:radical SAM/SPASM domain-containing protein [Leptothoe sp. PORK10 BA2]|uniref:radical SAM/SPASM domain-containing protein n=1 Tax=Leptothoe sp. PORK10 BA2 TaxID=3110254 RepID=UPI002B1F867D|nr:radical SAM/SPASM domain-containing protein [Leptothoe sp. PORK10 BA2]MEA5466856.1 radical SAM protein [Leptothoe sp. PORK10 BA2]